MKNNRSGFTLVELLVVLLIIAILAAIATPLYLQNAQRARASEAVATMSLIRQAQRDHRINTNKYFDIGAGNIDEPFPTTVADDGAPTPGTAGAQVNSTGDKITQYYSNAAYSVFAGNTPASIPDDGQFDLPNAQDFIIYVDGSASVKCAAGTVTDCAVKGDQVNGNGTASNSIDVKMDNSGRIFVSYNGGTTWELY